MPNHPYLSRRQGDLLVEALGAKPGQRSDTFGSLRTIEFGRPKQLREMT
jgi:hypothetical protein